MLVIVDRKKRYGRLLSRFIRRISVSEDAPKEELNRAFDAYKELAYVNGIIMCILRCSISFMNIILVKSL